MSEKMVKCEVSSWGVAPAPWHNHGIYMDQIRFLPLLGKGQVYIEVDRASRFGEIVDLSNWIGSPTRFPLNLSFDFVVYIHHPCTLRGASLGTRTELGMD